MISALQAKPTTIEIAAPGDDYDRFGVAIQLQDAVNLRALAREFVRIVDAAMAETGSTTKTWEDPAVRLVVNKFESLCRSEQNFSEAYHACQDKRRQK